MQESTPQVDLVDTELSETADFPDFEPSFSGNAFMRTLYLAEQGSVLSKEGERFVISLKGQVVKEIPSIRVDMILIFGGIQITTAAMQFCLNENIPVILLSNSGKYYGSLESTNKMNVVTHKQQFDFLNNTEKSLQLAQLFIKAKIHNQRVVLQRYGKRRPEISLKDEIDHLERLKIRVQHVDSKDKLFAIEGVASQEYFNGLRKIIPDDWMFRKRTKQPPRDPVNS
ncbi:MAG: CRISPR-associated endonuclease Cas1, partial [Thermodesulfovibrionales bacterium]|nr:CRISPR-associated endonuclease Cas1 [Thermodesulfovibrionales bacterium]